MTFFEKLVHGLTWLATLLFTLVLGGNLYEQTVILPYWGDNPPATLQFWRDIMESGHFTFYYLTPICILVAAILLAIGWRRRDLRPWLAAALVSIVLVLAITLVLAVPQLKILFPWKAEELDAVGVAKLQEAITRLQLVSMVRWAVLLAGCLSLIRGVALSAPRSPT